MTILLSALFLIIFIYVNTLFYSMVLLAIVLAMLYLLVSNLMMHTLTIIMLAIVYIGAMMILIGYICAICPNLILAPSHMSFAVYIGVIGVPFLGFPFVSSPSFNSTFIPIVNYFYSYSGLLVFLTLVFILFVTLLMVTSQYITPNGPFRSVTI